MSKTLGTKKLIYDPKFWLVAELKTFSGIPLPWENDEELSTFFIIDYCNLEYNMVNFLNLTLLLGQVSLLCQKTFLFVSWPLWKKFWVVLQKKFTKCISVECVDTSNGIWRKVQNNWILSSFLKMTFATYCDIFFCPGNALTMTKNPD